MKKKTLDDRKQELQACIIALIQTEHRLVYLKFKRNNPDVCLAEEEAIELQDLPIDSKVYGKRIAYLRNIIKKMEETDGNYHRRGPSLMQVSS